MWREETVQREGEIREEREQTEMVQDREEGEGRG